jgi:glycosyltransferase involved in cell wall biosynthesis
MMAGRKKLSVMTPCYNEEGNIRNVYEAIREIFSRTSYDYEHLIIDNNSTDSTPKILREIAASDKNVKVIFNYKNFGQANSPYYATLLAEGDAVITYMADMQDPPEMILDFIKKWEGGHDVVIGIKKQSKDHFPWNLFKKLYYFIIAQLSENGHFANFSGFGLYDQSFIKVLRQLNVQIPYFRGLVSEYGRNIACVEYTQGERKRGRSKNNFWSLFDYAMIGIVNQSRIPLRVAIFIGFSFAFINLLISFGYFVYKLLYWDSFQLGIAPAVIGIFFFFSLQLIFIGILGEYVGIIYLHVKQKPLVIERERLNFD